MRSKKEILELSKIAGSLNHIEMELMEVLIDIRDQLVRHNDQKEKQEKHEC